MSKNCINCVVNERTGTDLLCDRCRSLNDEHRARLALFEAEEDKAQKEVQNDCDHEWSPVDDSFDHEYGCEQIHYWRCEKCELTRPREASDEL